MINELHLSVKRSVFRRDDPVADHAAADFKKIRPAVLERDNRTCQYCDFTSERFQEVHHLNDDHHDNQIENLVTVCSLCHLSHHVGFAGLKKAGTLIAVDDLSQVQINGLVRNFWVGERYASPTIASRCAAYLNKLQSLNIEAKRLIGTADPAVLGEFLLNLSDDAYQNRGEKLASIRLLPAPSAFKSQIKFWSKGILLNMHPERLLKLAQSKTRAFVPNNNGSH